MSIRFWDDRCSTDAFGPGMTAPKNTGIGVVERGAMLGAMERHTEFVAGLDWCMFGGEGWIASTGWDEGVWVFDAKRFMGQMGAPPGP